MLSRQRSLLGFFGRHCENKKNMELLSSKTTFVILPRLRRQARRFPPLPARNDRRVCRKYGFVLIRPNQLKLILMTLYSVLWYETSREELRFDGAGFHGCGGLNGREIWGRGRGMAGEARRANGVGSVVVATVFTSTMP